MISRRGPDLLLASLFVVLLASAPVSAQSTHLVVVSGLGGDPVHSDDFYQWSVTIIDAALAAGIPEDQVTYLAEDPMRDPERIDARASRDELAAVLQRISAGASAADQLWLVLIGHGSAAGQGARFNLPGPDWTDADYAAALDGFQGSVAFVNTASSSGGFLASLSGDDRAVVTATKSATQGNETVFPRFFAEALENHRGDIDKDDRVSLYEAFVYARNAVKKHYEVEQLLATEHAHLDDNGDRIPTQEPDPLSEDPAADGRLASRLILAQAGAAVGPGTSAADSEAIAALLTEKAEIEQRIEDLRRQRSSLDEEVYLDELESLMVELALKQKALDELQESRTDGATQEEKSEEEKTSKEDSR